MGVYRRQDPESIARRERRIVENMLQVRRLETLNSYIDDDGMWVRCCKGNSESLANVYLSRAKEETDLLILEQSLEPPE